MITYLLGLPGSGKSYFAVDKIFNNFSTDPEAKKDKKLTLDICYTNINELNLKKLLNVHFLDFDKLKIQLSELHEMTVKKKCTDEELIEKLKEYDLYNAFFVIDEAHHFFDRKDTVLVWWLSYHRHLFHEIILITQNLSLIESKYKAFSEFFYVAKPQSLTLNRSYFKYNVFCSPRLSLTSKSGSFKLKRNKKVFDLYKSGDSINAQNVVLKFILISIFLFLLAFSLLYYFISSKTSSSSEFENIEKDLNIQTKISSPVLAPASVHNSLDFRDKLFFEIDCTKSLCSNYHFSFHPNLLKKFTELKQIEILNESYKTHLLKTYSVSIHKDFFKFLKGVTNEENSNNIDFFSGFSGESKQ